jgi:hypothetical protein
MTKLDLVKSAVSFTVGAGVSHVITGVVTSNVPQNNVVQKALTFTGRVAITMLVSEMVQSHVSRKIDDAVEWYMINVRAFPDK